MGVAEGGSDDGVGVADGAVGESLLSASAFVEEGGVEVVELLGGELLEFGFADVGVDVVGDDLAVAGDGVGS